MSSVNNTIVVGLLNRDGKSAPQMTRSLSVLGDGSMADGLVALWEDGQKNGIIKGAVGASVFISAGVGLYVLIKNKLAEQHTKQTIRVARTEEETNYTKVSFEDNAEMNKKRGGIK